MSESENKKPWFCKPCEAWCHSDMKTCPRCTSKDALRFPSGDHPSGNPGVGRGAVETGGGEVGETGVGRVPAPGPDEGWEDVLAVYEEARKGW